jgi:hypothetical protein
LLVDLQAHKKLIHSNDDQQYQALMNNALTTAKALNLRPGIALSPAQMALLSPLTRST